MNKVYLYVIVRNKICKYELKHPQTDISMLPVSASGQPNARNPFLSFSHGIRQTLTKSSLGYGLIHSRMNSERFVANFQIFKITSAEKEG